MKRIVYIAVIIVIQHSTINIQHSFGQSSNDNRGSGNCLNFDGVNDYVQIPDANSLDVTNELTVSAWIQLNSTPGVQAIVTKYDSGPGAESFHLSMSNTGDELQFFVTSTGAGWPYTFITSDNVNFQANQWYHVVGTYNSVGTDNIHLFVNGEEVAGTITNRDGGANTIEVTTVPVLIGGYFEPPSNTPHRPFDGLIDEVQVWNIALTENQIKDNMCTQLQGNEAGLVGYWNMNEGTGNTVGDLTSNNNDGTRQ